MTQLTETISTRDMRKKIFDLVWPATVESVLQMMVGIVSSAMLGRVGALAIGSVGLGRRVTMLIWGVFAAIGTGTTVMVARSVGAEDRPAAGRYAEQAFVLTMFLVLTLTTAIFLFPRQILVFLYSTDGELLATATTYLRLVSLGIPFMAVMQVTGAIMRGAGNTRVPMQVATVINLVNVVLSYGLIFGKLGFPALGIVGAAWAQVIAQACGAALALYIMVWQQTELRFRLRSILISWSETREVLGIGVPTAVENLLMQFGQIMLTGLVVSFGTVPLAAHQQGFTAESLSYMPAVGFGIAATALVGQSIGAGSTRMAQRYVKELAKWNVILTVCTASFLIFTPRALFGLLSNEREVIELGARYLVLMGVAQIPQQLSGVLNGALRGSGDTKAPMVVAAIGLWGVRIPLAFYFSRSLGMGIMGVWIAMTIDLFVRFSLSATRYLQGRWRENADKVIAARRGVVAG